LLNLVYYPSETWRALTDGKDEAARRALLYRVVPPTMEMIRELARRYTLKHVERIIPDPFDAMFRELLFSKELARSQELVDQLVQPFLHYGRDQELVRLMARVVRNLRVGELVVAGDLGDRGPRIDKVIDLLMQQPNVTIRGVTTTRTGWRRASAIPPRSRRWCACRFATAGSRSSRRATVSRWSRSSAWRARRTATIRRPRSESRATGCATRR
jgi:hypothetical protein